MSFFSSFSSYQKTTLYILSSLAFITSLASFSKWKRRKNEELLNLRKNGDAELSSLINEWKSLQGEDELKKKIKKINF